MSSNTSTEDSNSRNNAINGDKNGTQSTPPSFSEPAFQALVNDAPYPIVRYDKDCRRVFVNPAFTQIVGIPAESLLNNTPTEQPVSPDAAELEKNIREALSTGIFDEYEFRIEDQHGAPITFLVRIIPERQHGKEISGVMCIGHDISKLKQADHELRILKTALNNSSDAIFLVNNEFDFDYVNDTACKKLGYSQEELITMSPVDIDPSVPDKRHLQELVSTLKKSNLPPIATQHKTRNGHIFPVEISTSSIEVDGKNFGLSICRDITERKQAEDALRESEMLYRTSTELLQSVLESSPEVMVFALDRNHRYQNFNTMHKETMRAIWGKDIALGMSILEVISSDDDRETAKRDFDRALAGESFVTEEAYGNERLSRKYWQIFCSPIRTNSGEIVGLTCFSLNISDRRHMEESLHDKEKNLREVARIAKIGSWELNFKTGDSIWSDEFFRILELDSKSTVPSYQAVIERIHPLDLELVNRVQADSINSPLPYELEHRLLLSDGQIKYVHVRCEPVLNDSGETTHLRGAVQDITERKLAEIALEESERHLSILVNFSPDAILAIDKSKQITVWNHAIEKMTGIPASEMLGKGNYTYMAPFYGYARPHLVDLFWNLENQISEEYSSLVWEGESVVGEVFCPALNEGKGMYISAKASPLRDAEGRLIGAIECIRDITERKRHEGELEYVANHDTMTGLPNRRLLADRIDQAVLHAKRSEKSLAVCYLDIDNFKPINDRYGHATGDQILIAASKRLKQIMRAEDTLARLGGDEFVLLFNDISSPEEISSILERLQIAFHAPLEVENLTVSLSTSIGVTLYPEDNVEADLLLRHADQAMYRAKQTGKNRFLLFDPDREQEAQNRRMKTQQLQRALENDEFVLHYQPKVDLHNNDIIGFEALIRWEHPKKGLLFPADFLHYLQGNELEIAFGEWVINSVLSQIDIWQENEQAFVVSANISPGHLLSANFSERLQKNLEKHPNVAPWLLELEILETAALSDMQNAVATLHRCQELGVKISLDDFGTGHSSLTYLRNLPVDILKIDRSFISNMLTDESDHSIVLSVVQLAHTFNRQVIAEGVESIEQGAMLYQLGCQIVQGYGIAKPMPVERIPTWIGHWKNNTEWKALGSATGGI